MLRVCTAFALLVGAFLTTLLFADELVRLNRASLVASPVPLPANVQIREAPALVRIIGSVVGGAAAVTVGRTILVPRLVLASDNGKGALVVRDTLFAHPATWQDIVVHERAHVLQRERHGRWYLPLYLYWFVRRGYADHPFEREADSLP